MLEGFVGALCAFVFAAMYGEFDRWRKRRASRIALATEIATVVQLIQANSYIELLETFAKGFTAPGAGPVSDPFVITAQQGYFTIYEALAGSIGDLDEGLAIKTVSFYQGAKSLVDTFSPDGARDQVGIPASEAVGFFGTLAARMRNLIVLGDDLVSSLAGPSYLPKIDTAAKALLARFEPTAAVEVETPPTPTTSG